MARKNEWPLDKMCLQCDVTKKHKEDFSSSPREGAYIHSLYMEGARWDTQTSLIAESILKDLTPTMPVIFIKVNCGIIKILWNNKKVILYIKRNTRYYQTILSLK